MTARVLLVLLGFCLILNAVCLPVGAEVAARPIKLPPADSPTQVYYPGDIVRLIVEAPFDTAAVTARMPDDQTLDLKYNRRSKVWYEYWEVPFRFKKGYYVAKLSARDLEGREFSGESNMIVIGEPTLPVVLSYKPTEEVRTITVMPEPEPEAKPVREETVETKVQARPARVVRPAAKLKKPAAPAAKTDLNAVQMRLMEQAREALDRGDYEKAMQRLQALTKIAPKNAETKRLLGRIEAVLKAKEGKQ